MDIQQLRNAWHSIWNNKLRTYLTIVIIALGIASLVGMLSAIDALQMSVKGSVSQLGSEKIAVKHGASSVRRRSRSNADPISLKQAEQFLSFYPNPESVTLSYNSPRDVKIHTVDKVNDASYQNRGIDHKYLAYNDIDLIAGRPIQEIDINKNAYKVIIGYQVFKDFFDGMKTQDVIGQRISIDNIPFVIQGIAAKREGSFGANPNTLVLIPYTLAIRDFSSSRPNMFIDVYVDTDTDRSLAEDEIIAAMRLARKLKIREENDFHLSSSEGLASILDENDKLIRIAAIIIALLTLFASTNGLTNIMLISVSERTREIGLRKSVGADYKDILNQFLAETMMISLLGALLGIILGIGFGFLVAQLLKGLFVIPWLWIGIAIIIASAIGILAGIYPALRAAKLSPIEALRSI